MRRKILPFILGGALSIAAVAPAAAASINSPIGGLVNAVVQVEDVLNESLNDNVVQVLNVDISNSLNRLLQNAFQHADIDVLTNAVQNNLNNLDLDVTVTDITVVGDSIVINVLGSGGVADQIILS